MSLFAPRAPLAERMRPQTLDEFIGQQKVVGPGRALRAVIESGEGSSIILWGPPGTGKTTLARIIARTSNAELTEMSAVTAGIREVRETMQNAERAFSAGRRTVLFLDEIHRFNKAQQDAFLPYIERGTVRLIGATTENPSFEINGALLSRCRVYILEPLTEAELVGLMQRALEDPERGLGGDHLQADDEALRAIATYASGDARFALNTLEAAAQLSLAESEGRITAELVRNVLQQRTLRYDKSGDQHYDLISALHKSVRNSDADAALYWLRRMLAAGEDANYIARRLVRMASEDVGLAAPEALNLCLSAQEAMHLVGSPEGDLALAQATVYLALAPKSAALYKAWGEVSRDVEETVAEPVPLHLRNAPTRLMRAEGFGKGYQYAHDLPAKVAAMRCLPENLADRVYYQPTGEGRERALAQRLAEVRRLQRPEEPGGPEPQRGGGPEPQRGGGPEQSERGEAPKRPEGSAEPEG